MIAAVVASVPYVLEPSGFTVRVQLVRDAMMIASISFMILLVI